MRLSIMRRQRARRRASEQLSGSEALDDAQAAAAERTGPAGSERVRHRERDPARRVDASDQAAAQRQQLAAFRVGQESPSSECGGSPTGSTCSRKRRRNS